MVTPSIEAEEEMLEWFKMAKANFMGMTEDELRTYLPFHGIATGAKADKGKEPRRSKPEMVWVILWEIFTKRFTDQSFDKV